MGKEREAFSFRSLLIDGPQFNPRFSANTANVFLSAA